MATTWPSIISMAKRSNSRPRWLAALCGAILAGSLGACTARACPFCTALEPTWSQRRAAAAVTLLAEVESIAAGSPATLNVHQVLAGETSGVPRPSFSAPLDLAARPGQLLVLFGNDSPDDAQREWHAVAVDETAAAYLARAPRTERSGADRLAYFAHFLEHRNPSIAEDAYLEFGHAPLDVVAEAAAHFSMAQVRAWLIDPAVPGHRKGFYGLVLGLAHEPREQQANAELLRKLILAPDDDFRAGFDGILGGYLLLGDRAALELIESRYLANATAAVGDVRHAQTALRFYHEYGRTISKERICEATRHLLARPEFAAAAIIDLARWHDWQPLGQIAALYTRDNFADAAIRPAVIGYLLACPESSARRALGELRSLDPAGVAEAEQLLSRTGAAPQSQ